MLRAKYTIRQVAEALGVDKRTVERRVKEGALSAQLTRRGRQLVRLVDGAELARFAQAEGYELALTEGEAPATTPGAPNDNRNGATVDNRNEALCPSCEALRATVAAQERLIGTLEGEVRHLRDLVSQLTVRVLPPARPLSWWRRLWGGEKNV